MDDYDTVTLLGDWYVDGFVEPMLERTLTLALIDGRSYDWVAIGSKPIEMCEVFLDSRDGRVIGSWSGEFSPEPRQAIPAMRDTGEAEGVW